MTDQAAKVQTATRPWGQGDWDPRTDRLPSAVALAMLWAGMIAGFALDAPRYFHQVPLPLLLHIHGAIFALWMVLLTFQVLFVLKGRLKWHRWLGWTALGWAGLMALFGPWASLVHFVLKLQRGNLDCRFLAVNLADMIAFLGLLAWGVAARRRPAVHRRMMILATVALADPGFSRITDHVFQEPTTTLPWFLDTFCGNILIIGVLLGWDAWRGRLLRPVVLASAGMLALFMLASALQFWPPWRPFSLRLVQSFAQLAPIP